MMKPSGWVTNTSSFNSPWRKAVLTSKWCISHPCDVFVTQQEGFTIADEEHKVYKLKTAFYGLRQAQRAWNIKLNQKLMTIFQIASGPRRWSLMVYCRRMIIFQNIHRIHAVISYWFWMFNISFSISCPWRCLFQHKDMDYYKVK